MLLIFYRFLPKSTACPNFIYFYDHNVYDEDDDRWRKRQMKTYTLLIVDDQADAAEQLRSGIEGISPGVFDIAVMNDVQAIQQIYEESYDAYFLDIEMPSCSGFQLASRIKERDKDALIIFQTTHEDYSVWGYDYAVFRFISKYKLMQMLPGAIQALKEELARRNVYMEAYNSEKKAVQLAVHAIHCAYMEHGMLTLVTEGGTFTARCGIHELMSAYPMIPFAIPQKGYIVNLEWIGYLDYENNMIYMKQGGCVKISRRKRMEFYQRYSEGY